MIIQSYHKIYFIGIGGIGMSAIARYLHSLGKIVSGYDKTETKLTRALQNEGIEVCYQDSLENLPEEVDLVIYTPAIPSDSVQLNYYLDRDVPVIKRAEALGWISKSTKTIAVAGTHGKTSTSSMISQLLLDGEVCFSAFLGGISYGLNSNYLGRGQDWVVVEADEYDRSFLHLEPTISVLISMDPDHLDIYGDLKVMQEGFWQFVMKIQEKGLFIFRSGLDQFFPADWKEQLDRKEVKWKSYGYENSDIIADDVKVHKGRFEFNYVAEEGIEVKNIQSALPGRHNIENTLAALTVGFELGLSRNEMVKSIRGFKGIFRRFERLFENHDLVYIDDYAHHPTELRAAIGAAKELYPDRYLLGVFQPHLFSRTKDFAKGFAQALEILDEVILMEIYPAREKPIPGITADSILSEIKKENKHLISEENAIIERLEKMQNGVILTLGAGDIDLLRDPIIKMLNAK